MDLVDCLLRGDRAFCRLLDGAAVFESEEEERQTWYLNRDMLLSLQTGQLSEDFRIYVGNRPWGWWKYGSGLGSEIWSDPERFGINWQRWQYDFLKEHNLLFPGEEEAVLRLCACLLEQPRYDVDDPHLQYCFTDGGEAERQRRREVRKALILDD